MTILPYKLGICRLEGGLPLPGWLTESESFYTVTGTVEETSIVCREDLIPAGCRMEKGYIALKVEGPLAFTSDRCFGFDLYLAGQRRYQCFRYIHF